MNIVYVSYKNFIEWKHQKTEKNYRLNLNDCSKHTLVFVHPNLNFVHLNIIILWYFYNCMYAHYIGRYSQKICHYLFQKSWRERLIDYYSSCSWSWIGYIEIMPYYIHVIELTNYILVIKIGAYKLGTYTDLSKIVYVKIE